MILNSDQRLILQTIFDHDGQWTWYQVGRSCIGEVSDPAMLELRQFIEAGLIEERKFTDESSSRLFVTKAG